MSSSSASSSSSQAVINEYVLQPRTGSQCPHTKSATGVDICAGSDDKQMSWNDNHIMDLTLGFSKKIDYGDGEPDPTLCAADPTNDDATYWAFGKIHGTDKFICIDPVWKLCGLKRNTWDGYNYNPDEWTSDEVSEPLMSALKNAQFSTACDQYNSNNIAGNLETPMSAQQCPLKCTYDVDKFTTLAQIEDYELKFGKYDRDDRSGCEFRLQQGYKAARECLRETVGAMRNGGPSNMYSDNYNKIMTNFCSQKSTVCGVEPLSVGTATAENKRNKKRPFCSVLQSDTPEGEKCRTWLNSFGPYKFKVMDDIGAQYCTQHPSSDDCLCFSREDPDNPNYESYQKIVKGMAESDIIMNPACFYKPCADPTNYIVGTDVFKPPTNNFGIGDSSYGFNCIDNVCASILNIDGSVNDEMSGNEVYIQCGEGLAPGESGGGFFEKNIRSNVYVFVTFIIACVVGGILLLMLFYKTTTYVFGDSRSSSSSGASEKRGGISSRPSSSQQAKSFQMSR